MTKKSTTNTVKFGKFAIVLEKDQLLYYTDGQLMKCIDVNPSFNNQDLFDLANRISTKNNYGIVEFTTKDKVVKQYR